MFLQTHHAPVTREPTPPLLFLLSLPHQPGQLLLHLRGRLGEVLAPEECRPAAAAATLSRGFIRTGMAARAFGLKLAGERGEEGSGRGGPLLRYYMLSIQNITVPLKEPQQLFNLCFRSF